MNKRSISTIISVVLLILVVVILTSVVLNWSQLFANKQVIQVSNFTADTIDVQDSILMVKSEQASSDGYTDKIIVKNLTSKTTGTITAYKIVVAENPNNYSFLNTKINLATNVELTPGNIGAFEIPCYPSKQFDILLYTDKNTYVPVSINAQKEYSSLSCDQYYA